MNKQIEALKMAVREMTDAIPHLDIHFDDYFEAINACKEALAEAESESNSQPVAFNGKEYMEGFNAGKMFAELEHTAQEPVAKLIKQPFSDTYQVKSPPAIQWLNGVIPPIDTLLYTHPATWQSLSNDEIRQASLTAKMQEHYMGYHSAFTAFARAIEQALKEKNHG